MKIIEPKVELWQQGDDAKAHVARCARVCYGIVQLIVYLNVENNGKYL